MTITFINMNRAIITVLVLALIFALYAWQVRPMLRRRPEFNGFFDYADTRWQRIGIWIKLRWDVVAAGAVALFPILWNGALDAIVGVSILGADLLPAIAGIDLSELVMAPWLKTSIQIGAAVLPVIRAQLMTKDKG